MRHLALSRPPAWLAGAALCALSGCGIPDFNQDPQIARAQARVDAVVPAVLPATGPTIVELFGSNFLGEQIAPTTVARTSPSPCWSYPRAQITFTATSGTPFHGGTSATYAVTVDTCEEYYGPLASSELIRDGRVLLTVQGTGVVGVVQAHVQVVTTWEFNETTAESQTAIVTFTGP